MDGELHPLADRESFGDPASSAVLELASDDKAEYSEVIEPSEASLTNRLLSVSLSEGPAGLDAEDVQRTPPATMTSTLQLLESNSQAIEQMQVQLQMLLNRELFLKAHQLALEQQHLLKATHTNLGFHKGRPVLPLVVHRCCLRWGLYQSDKSGVLDRILSALTEEIDKEDPTPRMDDRVQQLTHFTSWLGSACVLLVLVHKHTVAKGGQEASGVGARITAMKKTVASRIETFGFRMASLMSSSNKPVHQQHPALASASRPNDAAEEERKSQDRAQEQVTSGPAAFRQGLDAQVQRLYVILRECCKRSIAALVSECVQLPADAMSPPGSPRPSFTIDDDTHDAEHVDGNAGPAAEKLASLRSWCELVSVLNEVLEVAKAQLLPKALTKCLFWQLLSFIDVQLFNQLLLRPECCSSSNAKYVMEGLNRLDGWLLEVGQEYIGDAYHTLQHIRQAVSFLAVENKDRLSIDDIAHGLCPALNIQQIYRLSTTFWDSAAAETVSGEVLEEMKSRNVMNNGGLIVTFLLEDDAALPFTAGGATVPSVLQIDEQELAKGVPVPDVLREEEAVAEVFKFLELDLPAAS